MRRSKYHVTPVGKGTRRVKGEGASRADSVHERKSDAVERARDLSKSNTPGQVIIQAQDSKIQTEYTYGSDPYPPQGSKIRQGRIT